MARKAKDAKGIFLATVSDIIQFIFPHGTYHHMTLYDVSI